MELDLTEIRKDIDKIDEQLLELFKQRMTLTGDVARYKAKNNMVVFQGDREKAIIERVKENSPEELKKSAAFLFMNIMDISKCAQAKDITPDDPIVHISCIMDRPSVAVQGVEGAYGHAAYNNLFKSGNASFYASFAEVFEAVENGDVDYGILPIENNTAGEVTVNMELLEKHHVFINRTTTVECAHVLAAKKGVKEQDIKILFGHEQAIRQCDSYIESRRDLTVIPYHNNGAAALMVSENASSELGCICSEECAEMHGLDILHKGIATDPNNATRFICISKNMEVYDGADTIAVSLSIPNFAGSLYRMLTKFAVNGINMSKIQSKPLPVEIRLKYPDDHMFYIEFPGNINDSATRKLLKNFETEYNYFKLHGNFL
ncbi:MAG: bifunctional chorismate mutase/prephenate dehydratase [Ruminococcaceae bacterium]|nr:bifunctional chorismate mutase/prephenate dehydratase [Oscillospiraceae bacterium]